MQCTNLVHALLLPGYFPGKIVSQMGLSGVKVDLEHTFGALNCRGIVIRPKRCPQFVSVDMISMLDSC